eukprot:Hpha_TRINITY_DN15056_c0_g10::TRINITY_DN15056_c0_g10_i3::g.126156::m.126156
MSAKGNEAPAKPPSPPPSRSVAITQDMSYDEFWEQLKKLAELPDAVTSRKYSSYSSFCPIMDTLLRGGEKANAEGDNARAYMLLMNFALLVSTLVRKHPDYTKLLEAERQEVKGKLTRAVLFCEALAEKMPEWFEKEKEKLREEQKKAAQQREVEEEAARLEQQQDGGVPQPRDALQPGEDDLLARFQRLGPSDVPPQPQPQPVPQQQPLQQQQLQQGYPQIPQVPQPGEQPGVPQQVPQPAPHQVPLPQQTQYPQPPAPPEQAPQQQWQPPQQPAQQQWAPQPQPTPPTQELPAGRQWHPEVAPPAPIPPPAGGGPPGTTE